MTKKSQLVKSCNPWRYFAENISLFQNSWSAKLLPNVACPLNVAKVA